MTDYQRNTREGDESKSSGWGKIRNIRKVKEVVYNQRTNIDDVMNGYLYGEKVGTILWR